MLQTLSNFSGPRASCCPHPALYSASHPASGFSAPSPRLQPRPQLQGRAGSWVSSLHPPPRLEDRLWVSGKDAPGNFCLCGPSTGVDAWIPWELTLGGCQCSSYPIHRGKNEAQRGSGTFWGLRCPSEPPSRSLAVADRAEPSEAWLQGPRNGLPPTSLPTFRASLLISPPCPCSWAQGLCNSCLCARPGTLFFDYGAITVLWLLTWCQDL